MTILKTSREVEIDVGEVKNTNIIGVVGGLGPRAGADLVTKILDQTLANKDQEHLPVMLLSMPQEIEDRTEYIFGRTSKNPAIPIYNLIKKLEVAGANVIGIACNTSHAPAIFDVIQSKVKEEKSRIKLLNLVNEVVQFIEDTYPHVRNVAALTTMGAYKSRIYGNALNNRGFNFIELHERKHCELVHNAIYDPNYGIKAKSKPVSNLARRLLLEAIKDLQLQGAEAIILGCTEISLAIHEEVINNTVLIDSSLVLARALIRECNRSKLKKYEKYREYSVI